MKDYALSSLTDAGAVHRLELDGPEAPGSERLAGDAVESRGKQRNCLICHEPLTLGERKVHRGECARRRSVALQQARRRRKRR